jgi:isoquinoline 1-oxidoreductase subunit beta
MYFLYRNRQSPGLPNSPGGEITRRQFLKLTTIAGSGLTLGVALPGSTEGRQSGARASAESIVTPFVQIHPDNTVIVIVKFLEAGQGVYTGLSAIVAEELDASWNQMRVQSAPAELPTYGLVAFNGVVQMTGGSISVADSWNQLRQAGATARAMLVQAAAEQWHVRASEIQVSEGIVSHPDGEQRATFGQLAGRAAKLRVPNQVKLKEPAQFKLIGRTQLPRLDSKAKSTGKQQFAIDVMLPGMMTAVVLRPPRFKSKVLAIDASKARAIPGVVDVVQIPRGVAIVARDMWSAKKGREALLVTWDESGAEKRGTGALMEEYRRLGQLGNAPTESKAGDVESAMKRAVRVFQAEFEFPYLAHAPMEPLTAVCRLGSDICEIWAGSQAQTWDQAHAAAAVGLNAKNVIIHSLAAGGSFGRRATPDGDYISEVASIAKATGGKYPVRLIWTREDDITGGRYRPMFYHHHKVGIDKDGKPIAYQMRLVGQSLNEELREWLPIIGTQFQAMLDGPDASALEGNAPEQYAFENHRITYIKAKVGVPVLWWRSVGHTHHAFAAEIIIDELAELAGQDPVAFRLALLQKRPRAAATLQLAAAKAGWHQPFAKGPGRGRGVAVHEAFGTVVAQVAEVTVKGPQVTVDRVVCAVDCGTAVTPDVVKAQMQSGIGYGISAALHGKITMTDGRVDQTNFHQYRVLRMNEMPRVLEVYIVPSAEAPSGVGEPGVPPIAPALANAIRSATGLRLRKLPFDLEAAARDRG